MDMLGGRRCRIDDGSFRNDMTSMESKDDVFMLLVHLGYLAYDEDKREVYIPSEQALRSMVIMAYLSGADHYLRIEDTADGRGYGDILFLPGKTSGKHICKIEKYSAPASLRGAGGGEKG